MKKILTAIVLSLGFLGASAYSQIQVGSPACQVGNPKKCEYDFRPTRSRTINITEVAGGKKYICHLEKMNDMNITNLTGKPGSISLSSQSNNSIVSINASSLAKGSFGEGIISIYDNDRTRLTHKIFIQCQLG